MCFLMQVERDAEPVFVPSVTDTTGLVVEAIEEVECWNVVVQSEGDQLLPV